MARNPPILISWSFWQRDRLRSLCLQLAGVSKVILEIPPASNIWRFTPGCYSIKNLKSISYKFENANFSGMRFAVE
jgi:hypothetical protein